MRAILIALLSILAAPAVAQTPTPAYDAEAWVADLHQVREAMGSHYANLDWAATERETPFPQLFAAGEQRLRAAHSEAEAREVFERLEQYLGDGHVDFVWPRAGGAIPTGGETDDGEDDRPPCERLGFHRHPPAGLPRA